MFSQLGPLFKTVLRQTEKSDARLEIKRDEKQDQGKKQEFESSEEEASFLWDDSTGVSVEALKAFLIEFLKTKNGDSDEETDLASEAAAIQPQSPKIQPVNNIAAKAVKAYASIAAQTAPPALIQTVEAPENETDLSALLEADEIRTIHVLIHELDLLARRGIENLTIEKADTFLESLVQAVRLEKSKA